MRRPPPPPPRRGSPLWAKLSTILGAIVFVLAGAGVAVPKIVANQITQGIEELPPDPLIQGQDISGPINFLLLGLDVRLDASDDGTVRSDSIMILHITADHKQAYLVSLPRDALADIPPLDETGFPGWYNKINAAFSSGAKVAGGDSSLNWTNRERDLSAEGIGRGASQMIKTIQGLVPAGNLQFQGAAVIYFDGFLSVLEALNGVTICADEDVYSIHYWADGNRAAEDLDEHVWPDGNVYEAIDGYGYHYSPGCQHMEPWQALDYSRQRHYQPDGDYSRQRHQQQLIKAIVSEIGSVSTLTDLGKISRLQDAAGELLKLNLGGHTVEEWAYNLKSIRPGAMTMIKTNGGNFYSQYRNYDGVWSGECYYPDPAFDSCDEAQLLIPDSINLLQAVANDTVYDFLVGHTSWIATDASATGP